MKVAVSFPGCHRRGGVERVVLEAVNFLAPRHEVHLFAHEWDRESIDPRVSVHRVAYPRRLPLARVRRYPAAAAAAMRRVGVAFDAHAAFGVMSPPGGTIWVGSVHAAWLRISRRQRDLRGRLRQRANPYHHHILRLERRVFAGRRYRRLIALTDEVKRDLVDHYGVPGGDVSVLPNGFAPGEFHLEGRREREAVRRRFDLPLDARVVVFVANETERKGFGPLVRAMAALDEPDLHLLAVGRLDAAAYRDELRRLGLSDRVRFTGPLGDVASAYAAADCFALPTQYEAWGLVIVEAMACGLPVLTSRLAGAAVAVAEGRTGELLDDPRDMGEIRDKLRRLLDGRHAGARAIHDAVAGYRWEAVLRRHEAMLAEDAAAPARAG